jgi:hypothetical protein
MTTEEVVAYFKGRRTVAEVLGVSVQSVAQWGDCPPLRRQLELEKLTVGKLKAEGVYWHQTQAQKRRLVED